MAYSKNQKKEMLKILINKDFDIKNSVLEYNKKNNTRLIRATVYSWLENDKDFKSSYDLYLKELLDEAEYSHRLLRKGIPVKNKKGEIIEWTEKPDRAAIEFFLKVKGKERGYSEKTEIDITSKGKSINKNTTVTFINARKKDKDK